MEEHIIADKIKTSPNFSIKNLCSETKYTHNLAADLIKIEDEGNSICVGIIGCGEMGTDLVTQISLMRGIYVGGIADRSGYKAEEAIIIAGFDKEKGKRVDSIKAFAQAVEIGKIALVEDSHILLNSPHIDVVIDATGRPDAGAELGLAAIKAGKHLVMMNVEADVTIGRYLKREAQKAGLVYTLGAGDEPTAAMELINFVNALGYPIIAAGKGKNNPLNIDAVPDDYREEAISRNMNPRMLVEFIDGSKTMVEMAAIANATGLKIDIPGMNGPEATLDQLDSILIPKEDGGILSQKGVVEYTIGKGVAPGVFVVVKMGHPRLCERMHDLKLGGKGPYYTFYRPHHLTSLEVPLSAARAVLYGEADMVPLEYRIAEVCAKAKKDLKPGDILDSIGETCYRSFTLNAADAKSLNAWPVGVIKGGKVIEPIAKGELITRDKVFVPNDNALMQMLYALEDKNWQ